MANKKDKYVNYSNCESVRTNSRVYLNNNPLSFASRQNPFFVLQGPGALSKAKVRVRVATLRDQILQELALALEHAIRLTEVRLSGVRIFEVLL